MYSYYVLLVYVSILCVKKYLLNLYARSIIIIMYKTCKVESLCMYKIYYITLLHC